MEELGIGRPTYAVTLPERDYVTIDKGKVVLQAKGCPVTAFLEHFFINMSGMTSLPISTRSWTGSQLAS